MVKRQKKPTPEAIRKAYISEFLKRKPDAENFAYLTEMELATFIRKHVDAHFTSIYECTDHHFYDRVRINIAIKREMNADDSAKELLYSVHLKTYSDFLKSKSFQKLFKQKINIEGTATSVKSQSFREEREGERKHIDNETEVIRRNPRLRQQCLDKYGYQCQCCGMDFAEIYGDELGANFIEVHHLKPISTFETDGIPESFVDNLVPLCSNCHSMIHHLKDSDHTLRDLREAYKGIRKEIKIWKQD